ncbi:MAG TPA: RsmE family RNA methyltransferase, partial [Flavitalea sp.]|nr:RsmE family RNA methyltransferase [Flavitalea sp.]
RHISAVLRMQEGEELQLTDGQGNLYTATIVKPHKKHTVVSIRSKQFTPAPTESHTIAIALLKNATRFEWFLEKATELGINRIVPLITARTEKQHYKEERARAILVSAMMQSGQTWLPVLEAPQRIERFLSRVQEGPGEDFFVAHCMDKPKDDLATRLQIASQYKVIMIGPEGDFTEAEVDAAVAKGAVPVSLGNSRLRAETAGIIAVTLMKLVKPRLL